MFYFFKRKDSPADSKHDEGDDYIALPVNISTTPVEELEKIKEKLAHVKINPCKKLYPASKRKVTLLKDMLITGTLTGIGFLNKFLIEVINTDANTLADTKWRYEHEIRLNNKTCDALISKYTDLWHWCRGDVGDTPIKYLEACYYLRYCDTSGLPIAIYVLTVGGILSLLLHLKFRHAQYHAPLLAAVFLDANEREFLLKHKVSISDTTTIAETIIQIDARISSISCHLNSKLLTIIEDYLDPRDQTDNQARHFLRLMK